MKRREARTFLPVSNDSSLGTDDEAARMRPSTEVELGTPATPTDSLPDPGDHRIPASPEAPEAPEANLELRLAKWAIVAGLLAALIAGAAGVAGSALGAHMQKDAAQSQADREFLRTQQLDVYMEFLDAWQRYEDARQAAFSAVLALVSDRTSANDQTYSEALDAEYEAANPVSQLITKMAFVGSTDAHDAALAMWNAMKKAQYDRGGAQDQDEVLAISRTYREAVESERKKFYDAAQEDVSGSLDVD
jgi:hypothetical protein